MALLARTARRLFHCSSVMAALFVFATTCALAQDANAAFQIKAAFVQKFATYVTGPGTGFDSNDGDGALVFGVAGSDLVYDFLAQLAAAQGAGSRPAEVRRIATTDDLAGVNVLFVGEAATDAPALLQQGVAASMLTITDTTGVQPANSMIHFFIADDRVRFDIALAPAEAAGLRLSSRLLQVARQVTDE
jgi:hypothetical protein